MNTPPSVNAHPVSRIEFASDWHVWPLGASSRGDHLARGSTQLHLDRLALVALGLGAAMTLTAAYISTGSHAAGLPNWFLRLWHFGAPVVLGLIAVLGFSPGRSRSVRALAALTVLAYALPATLDRWDLPVLDGVPLKLGYGVTVLAVLGSRLAARLSRGHRESAV